MSNISGAVSMVFRDFFQTLSESPNSTLPPSAPEIKMIIHGHSTTSYLFTPNLKTFCLCFYILLFIFKSKIKSTKEKKKICCFPI